MKKLKHRGDAYLAKDSQLVIYGAWAGTQSIHVTDHQATLPWMLLETRESAT